MTAHCLKCNAHFHFRATRGNKLSNQRCQCGGRYELLSCDTTIIVTPEMKLPDGILPDIIGGKSYIYPVKNRAGKKFVFQKETRTYKPLEI